MEVEQRLFVVGPPGSGFEAVEAHEVRAFLRRQHRGEVAGEPRERQVRRTAATVGGFGARREQEVRLAAPGGAFEEQPVAGVAARGRVYGVADRVGAVECVETLVRRRAERERELRCHCARGGRTGAASTATGLSSSATAISPMEMPGASGVAAGAVPAGAAVPGSSSSP